MIDLALVGTADPRFRWFVAPVLRRRAGIRVVGFSEPETTSRDDAANLYGLTPWPDHRALLAATSPTLVAVAAPRSAEIVVDALQHGADVLVAPPLCDTGKELDLIAGAVAETGHQVRTVHSYRGHPAARTVAELREPLGPLEVVSVSLAGTADRSARLRSVADTLDLFTWLLGMPMVEADLQVDVAPGEADDDEVSAELGHLVATVQTGDGEGPVLEVRRQASTSEAREKIQVVGADGAVEWDVRDGTMRSAIGDRPPLTLSCGSFTHPEEWVLSNLIRRNPPEITTEHSLAVMRLLLAVAPALA